MGLWSGLAPSTILVEPGCQAEVTETGDVRIVVGAEAPSSVGAQLDPIHLSIFSHRFMSIAGEWRHHPLGPAPCSVRWRLCLLGRGGHRKCHLGEGAEAESWLVTSWQNLGWALWSWLWDLGPASLFPWGKLWVGGANGTWSLCAFRADGPHPAAHGHLHQHQGALGLLLRPLWARRGAGLQCPPHPCAPGRHAGDGAVPGLAGPSSCPSPLPRLRPISSPLPTCVPASDPAPGG